MGTYIYTLRNTVTNVKVDGHFVPVANFTYAFRDQASWRDEPAWVKAARTRAVNALDKRHQRDGAVPYLALIGGYVTVVSAHCNMWMDVNDIPGLLIGRAEKIGGRWQCVAQETTADLAFNSLGYDYDPVTGKVTRQECAA